MIALYLRNLSKWDALTNNHTRVRILSISNFCIVHLFPQPLGPNPFKAAIPWIRFKFQ